MTESLTACVEEKQVVSSKIDNETSASVSESVDESCAAKSELNLNATEGGRDVLRRLARQVEYYFSAGNLARDTYVSTLRSLNDGYVPLSIIANFGKVRSLVPFDAEKAVRQAANNHSNHLQVAFINSETGKRVVAEVEQPAHARFVEVVGPANGEPIPDTEIVSTSVSQFDKKPLASPVQNTIVLRDVPDSAHEDAIRKLFTFENCPSVQHVHKDVANCWFATLDTDSREVMVDVMFKLRSRKYESGEPVMARLKSGVVAARDAATTVGIYTDSPMIGLPINPNPSGHQANKKSKKKKSNSNRPRNNKNGSTQNKSSKGKTNTSNGNRRPGDETKQKKANKSDGQRKAQVKTGQNAPIQKFESPKLGEDEFPALPSDDSLLNPNKVEVEEIPKQDELGKKSSSTSDSSSTATTSSSTSSNKSHQAHAVVTGYAAALLKPALPIQERQEPTTTNKSGTRNKKHTQNSKANGARNTAKLNGNSKETVPAKNTAKEVSEKVEVKVQPPSWGHGSFAEILRQKGTSV